jgi:hypothetical protein
MDKKISFAIENFKNIQELIRFMDQKAGVLLIMYSCVVSTFIEFSKGLCFINPFVYKNTLISIFTFITGICLIILCLYQIYCIIFKIILPRKAHNYNSNETCLYYFGHIANFNKGQFLNEFNQLNDAKILEVILGQIYEVSKIMKQKSENFITAAKCLFCSVIILLLYILLIKLI